MQKIHCLRCNRLEPEIKIRELPSGGEYCQTCAVIAIEEEKKNAKVRCTVYVDHLENDDSDYELMQSWLLKWDNKTHVENYSSGGWEHCWDLETTVEAFEELPKEYLCSSDWAGI